MKIISLWFLYSLVLFLFLPVLFPSWRFFYFAPLIVFSYYKRPLIFCLWLSLFCGLIVDLFASHTRMGFYALDYCLTTWILHSQAKHFFEDSFSTLPLMTFLFSFVSTLIQASLLYAFGQGFSLSWAWITGDLFWMPLSDALFATFAFRIPLSLLPKSQSRRRTVLFSPKGKIS
jgi:rod shape-determining protein MreD